jgi:ketosteroid isomerase-like protein
VSDPRVELVRELFRRFNGGDRDSMLELMSEDFVVEVPPSLSAEPDVYEGHEGVERYLDAFEGSLEGVGFELLEFHREGDQVIVDAILKGRGVASGIDVGLRSAIIAWIEDGKVTRMLPCPDVESAREELRAA